MTHPKISNIRIPTGLIPELIDCVLDRLENVNETKEQQARANDLRAIIVELEDPGSVTWKADES